MVEPVRETIKCRGCELTQFRPQNNRCRRCGAPIQTGTVESTTVIFVGGAGKVGTTPVRTMRDVMQVAAVEAVRVFGGTMKAAKALQVPHSRVKQLLRETGDIQDYRKDRKVRRQRCTNR